MKKAFSLIELLISLVIISIIVAALTPIMTKKMSKSNMVVKVAQAKKGLQIYTNPGTYAFDVPENVDTIYLSGAAGGGGGAGAKSVTKNLSYTSSTTFTVPAGVNKITFSLIAGGGGGGGSYAKITSDTPCESGSRQVPAVADNGQDLCVTNLYPIQSDSVTKVVNVGEECNTESCCWKGLPSNSYHTVTCTRSTSLCADGKALNPAYPFPRVDYIHDWHGRYLSITELERFFDMERYHPYLGTSGINLCWSEANGAPNLYSAYVRQCYWYRQCIGANTNNCMPDAVFAQGGYLYMYGAQQYPVRTDNISDKKNSLAVLCTRNLKTWYHYTGAGGNSGAKLENLTIDVLPNDTLSLTVGAGGAGGGAYANGSDGSASILKHLRNGSQIAEYKALGGLGGGRATASAHGQVRLNSSSKANGGCSHSAYCKNAVETNDGKGTAGIDNRAGRGAGQTDSATLDNGEASAAGVGYNGYGAGWGGGGAVCARGVRNPSSCQKGGKGGNGKIEISYELITPGGGGGAGASANEIEYKVTPGERLVFTIGKGGLGGASNQVGQTGSATTFMENHIIFNPGGAGTFGAGGAAGILKINSSRAKLPVVSGVSAANIGKGSNGEQGQMKTGANYLSYGFDGGSGGTSFLGYFGGCGGGMRSDNNTARNCQTPSRKDGIDSITHNAVKNQYGGSGGGGGGILSGSSVLGAGGIGSDGYLRIRWGEE